MLQAQRFQRDVVVVQADRGGWVHRKSGAARDSGVEVGDQLALEPRDVVFQQQLALLESRQLQLVAADRGGQLIDRRIKVAMLHPELGEQMNDFGVILNLHGNNVG